MNSKYGQALKSKYGFGSGKKSPRSPRIAQGLTQVQKIGEIQIQKDEVIQQPSHPRKRSYEIPSDVKNTIMNQQTITRNPNVISFYKTPNFKPEQFKVESEATEFQAASLQSTIKQERTANQNSCLNDYNRNFNFSARKNSNKDQDGSKMSFRNDIGLFK